MHDAEYGTVVLYEGDIDGEFAVAVHELPGAVERIDEPVATPLAAVLEVRQTGFTSKSVE
jgi:hypothetical protein